MRDRDLFVSLDSGSVDVPGNFTAQSPVMMRDLYLTAYVASANLSTLGLVRADSARYADRRGWKAIAEGDSMLVAGALRLASGAEFQRSDSN